jgi:hypothetical protein
MSIYLKTKPTLITPNPEKSISDCEVFGMFSVTSAEVTEASFKT